MGLSVCDSSLGKVIIASNAEGICGVGFDENVQPSFDSEAVERELLNHTLNRINGLSDPVQLSFSGTKFQIQVWNALMQIPSGEMVSYSDLARKIGKPLAHRAVANACAVNKIAILIPCHRVICANGDFGEYRWGQNLKARILLREAEAQALPQILKRIMPI